MATLPHEKKEGFRYLQVTARCGPSGENHLAQSAQGGTPGTGSAPTVEKTRLTQKAGQLCRAADLKQEWGNHAEAGRRRKFSSSPSKAITSPLSRSWVAWRL